MKINVFKTEDEVLDGLANYFVEVAAKSIAHHGQFSVALSGGNSPKKLYELLASPKFRDKVEWKKVHFFFGDERYVPHTDLQSNYLMAKKAILEPLDLSYRQIFPVNTSVSPEEAAARYINDINLYFAGFDARFDLVLLGLGDNSHTASLFPHTPVLHDKTASVKEVFLDDQQVFRITMTAPLINQAHHIAYLVYGAGKAEAVHHVIEDKKDIENYPAQLIKPSDGELQWFLDTAAAALLKK
ncbi:6-phosphogluconolactonase [Mucilaginibacter ginsenosidivorans]|uniref:6-phosphogluconolactonase n=1 Tax=Mucilaginibacter ginsenosidivorans TaxID=398053 RepID=A0A5B8UYT6_9SPHI|nr:6-phosphogluconolactonase [Mucilaginibacter ginsenosidivorans]QEC64367.1 6-phosphogluconolactonase [Mucilaginibacter ginsenosidivorans]